MLPTFSSLHRSAGVREDGKREDRARGGAAATDGALAVWEGRTLSPASPAATAAPQAGQKMTPSASCFPHLPQYPTPPPSSRQSQHRKGARALGKHGVRLSGRSRLSGAHPVCPGLRMAASSCYLLHLTPSLSSPVFSVSSGETLTSRLSRRHVPYRRFTTYFSRGNRQKDLCRRFRSRWRSVQGPFCPHAAFS